MIRLAQALVVVVAFGAADAAYWIAGNLWGGDPFGPDMRPFCSAAPGVGLAPGCRYSPLQLYWDLPLLLVSLVFFGVVLVGGLILLRRRKPS